MKKKSLKDRLLSLSIISSILIGIASSFVVTYAAIINKFVAENNLQIMDLSAIELIKDEDIEIRISSMDEPSNFLDVVHGKDIGTICKKEGK